MITIARDVIMNFKRGGGSTVEALYGEVSLTPTLLHTLSGTAVLPAPTKRDLIDGTTTFPNVAPTPAPVNGQVSWAYKVVVKDRHGKTFEFLVGVPDGVTAINFVDLPRYFETRPPAYGIGPAGPAGQSATIAVGTVTSGPTPAVTNSGTSTEAVLNFTLAKGDKGDTGAGVPAGGSALQVVRKNADNTTTEWSTVDKALVGLGNVDNTSDANKPVSVLQATAIEYSDTLPLGARTAADAPSTYPFGVTVFIGNTSQGWPEVRGGFTASCQVRTERTPQYPSAIQYINARVSGSVGTLDDSDLWFRLGSFSDIWGAWQQIVTNNTEGVFVRKGELRTNVRDYGATGDGVTDDTPAIQRAMDAVGVMGGGVLWFPPGVYYLNSYVVLVDNVEITGNGATILKKGSSYSYVSFASFSGANKGYGSGANNVTCHDLTFKGSFNDASPRSNCGFSLHHAKNFTAYNLRFTECAGVGHQFDLGGCDTVTIRDCLFEGFRLEFNQWYSEAIQLDNSTRVSSSIPDADTAYDGLHTKNVTVDNCRFVPLTIGTKTYPAPIAVGSHGSVDSRYYTNINVINNYIEYTFADLEGNAPGPLHFYAVDGLTIENNTIVCGPNAANTRVIYMPRSSVIQTLDSVSTPGGNSVVTNEAPVPRNIRVVGNTFKGFKSPSANLPLVGIYGGPSNKSSANITVENNTFDDCNPINTNGEGQTGIVVTYSDNVEVSGNKAYQIRRLVEVTMTRSTNIEGNTVTGIVGSQVINAINPVGTLTIVNNRLTGFRATPIQVLPTAAARRLRISGNILTSTGENHQTGGRWVYVTNFKNAIVSDNILTLEGGTVTYGIQMLSASTGMVKNNILEGFGTGVNVSADSTVVVEGNI